MTKGWAKWKYWSKSGQNCTNLMFHLASALQNTPGVKPGDNIILSRWGNVLILKINLHLFVQNPAENYNTIVGRVKRIAMMLNDWQPLHSFLKWPLGFLISSTSFSHFDHFIDWLSTNCWISKKKIMKLYFGRLYKKITTSKDKIASWPGFLASGALQNWGLLS